MVPVWHCSSRHSVVVFMRSGYMHSLCNPLMHSYKTSFRDYPFLLDLIASIRSCLILPCLNWILTPASFWIFLIISPFLPMMMPTANLGTTTWTMKKEINSEKNTKKSHMNQENHRKEKKLLHPDCFPPFWIRSLPCQPWSLLGPCHGWASPQVHGLAIKDTPKSLGRKITFEQRMLHGKHNKNPTEVPSIKTKRFPNVWVEDWRHKMCKIESKLER